MHIFPNVLCILRNKMNLLETRRHLFSEMVGGPNLLSQLLAHFGTVRGKSHLGRTDPSFRYCDTPFLPQRLFHSLWGGAVFPQPSVQQEKCRTVCQRRVTAGWSNSPVFFFPPRANVSNKEHTFVQRHNSLCHLCHYDSVRSCTRGQQCLWLQDIFTDSPPSPTSHQSRAVAGNPATRSCNIPPQQRTHEPRR